ncbi:MAG: hypothetical protein ACE5GW_06660 [Planctomycetota bacterium]
MASLKKELSQSLRSRDISSAGHAIDALIKIGTAEAVDVICDVGLRADLYEFERAVGRQLIHIENPAGLQRLCRLANKHKDFRVRVILTLVLTQRPEAEAYKAVLTSLYDTMDSVVLTALEGLQRKNSLSSVDHLIRALKFQEEKGRTEGLVAYEIRRTLLKITGEDLTRADDWKNFWEPRKDTYVRPPADRVKERVTSVRKEPALFFGIEVPADRVVFILDVSDSMKIKDPLPEEPGAGGKKDPRGTGVGRGKKEKKPDPRDLPASRMRLTRVQKELIAVLRKLPPTTRFNIVTFNHEIGTFQEGLVMAGSSNKQRAIEFVRGFNATGETWTDQALEVAFGIPEVVAFFLLSDGAPRRNNQLLPIEPILEWVREENRFRRIRVNTVGFLQAGSNLRRFMRRLAHQNNGQYKELR